MDDCFHLGTISRSHGRKGAVQVKLNIDVPHDIKNWESVFLEINRKPVPFFVEEISGYQKKAIIKFEDINTPEEATRLIGNPVLVPFDFIELEDGDDVNLEALVGFDLAYADGTPIGEIVDVEEFPAQTMATIAFRESEILIPLHTDWITNLDPDARKIFMDLPDGLIDSQIGE